MNECIFLGFLNRFSFIQGSLSCAEFGDLDYSEIFELKVQPLELPVDLMRDIMTGFFFILF